MSDGDIDFEHLDGADITIAWGLPFVCLLLSISMFPIFRPHFWHKYMLYVALFFTCIMMIGMFIQYSSSAMLEAVLESFLHEYIPFIALIFSLFLVCGGIRIKDEMLNLKGDPVHNILILFVGVQLASWMGTTGASLLLIRPLVKSNKKRKHNQHVFIFFIFLVSNCGGALSPLGDPPLFLGFLKGVEFNWFSKFLVSPWAMVWSLELLIFFAMDSYFYLRYDRDEKSPMYTEPLAPHAMRDSYFNPRTSGFANVEPEGETGEGGSKNYLTAFEPPSFEMRPTANLSQSTISVYVEPDIGENSHFGKFQRDVTNQLKCCEFDTSFLGRFDIIDGWRNVPLLIGVPLTILITGTIEREVPISITIYHVKLDLEDIVRDFVLFSIGIMSLLITPKMTRLRNGFSWFPFLEVARLFFGIFMTMIPVVAILAAEENGDLAFVLEATKKADGSPNNFVYYFLTGILSSMLDNAPTFLIFFNLSGGDPKTIPDKTLMAISMGSVFMGALTYIGNAPNFMVKSICEDKGIVMPSFGMYIVWSFLCLFPVLSLVGWNHLR